MQYFTRSNFLDSNPFVHTTYSHSEPFCSKQVRHITHPQVLHLNDLFDPTSWRECYEK